MWKRSVILIGLFLLLAVQTAYMQGETIITDCSRQGLNNAIQGGGIVKFNCGTTTISINEEIKIPQDVTIDGEGKITLDGLNQTTIFRVESNRTLTVRNLRFINARRAYNNGNERAGGGAISGVYFANINVYDSSFENNSFDYTPSGDSGGGAIMVHEGTLVVERSTFIGNVSNNSSGGAIHNLLSNLTVRDSIFINNQAPSSAGDGFGNAGAIFIDGVRNADGFVVLERNRFEGNSSGGLGGAIYSFLYQQNNSTLINETTFINNVGDKGGGLAHQNGELILKNSTFTGNTSKSLGGGIWMEKSVKAKITNVTIVGNQAEDGYNGLGGGLHVFSELPISLTNVTIANNRASGFGGGISGGDSNMTLKNTIIANNRADNGGYDWNNSQQCGNELTDGGNNLQYPGATQGLNDSNCTAGVIIAEPKLGTLGNNGGLTETMPLNADSPAVDSGSCVLPTDQRGITRPHGNGCDIGAFEVASGGPIGTQLLKNSGFETLISVTQLPTDWTTRNLSKDKVKTNTEAKSFAHTGQRAFMFKGVEGEKSKLQQKLSADVLSNVSAGDWITLSAFIDQKSGIGGQKIVVAVVTYATTNPDTGSKGKAKIGLTLPAKSVSGYVQFSRRVALTDTVESIKVVVQYRGQRGKLFIDDIVLLVSEPAS